MATYTITLNERSAKGKALVEYLKALGVLVQKVSRKSVTAKHRLYDPETGTQLAVSHRFLALPATLHSFPRSQA